MYPIHRRILWTTRIFGYTEHKNRYNRSNKYSVVSERSSSLSRQQYDVGGRRERCVPFGLMTRDSLYLL